MKREQVLKGIFQAGIIPVIRTDSAATAIGCVEAILRGGISVLEITMTVPGALQVLEQLADRFGTGVLLGAGTVLDAETARSCMLAGAQFFVTPALKRKTIEIAKRYGKVIMPGALTPTEVLRAWEYGADAVRVVPCDAVGGAKYIKSLRAPFPHIELVATGGVHLDTIGEYFKAGACAVGVSGALIDHRNLEEGNYVVFTERARRLQEAVRRTREAMARAKENAQLK